MGLDKAITAGTVAHYVDTDTSASVDDPRSSSRWLASHLLTATATTTSTTSSECQNNVPSSSSSSSTSAHQTRRTLWFYGHKGSGKTSLFNATLKNVLDCLDSSFTKNKNDATPPVTRLTVCALAFSFEPSGKCGRSIEVVRDLLAEQPEVEGPASCGGGGDSSLPVINLLPRFTVDSCGVKRGKAIVDPPASCFRPHPVASLHASIQSALKRLPERNHAHILVTLGHEGRWASLCDLAGFVRTSQAERKLTQSPAVVAGNAAVGSGPGSSRLSTQEKNQMAIHSSLSALERLLVNFNRPTTTGPTPPRQPTTPPEAELRTAKRTSSGRGSSFRRTRSGTSTSSDQQEESPTSSSLTNTTTYTSTKKAVVFSPFRSNTPLTRLVAPWFISGSGSSSAYRFVLCASTEPKLQVEASSVLSFAVRAFYLTGPVPDEKTKDVSSSQLGSSTAAAAPVSLGLELAVVAIQQWFRRLAQFWRDRSSLEATEAEKRKTNILDWESRSFEALQKQIEMSKPIVATTTKKEGPAAKQTRGLSKKCSSSSMECQTETKEQVSCASGDRGDFLVFGARHRGVQCDALYLEEKRRWNAEKGEMQAEIARLSKLVEGPSQSQWQYILDKNSSQRKTIDALEAKIADLTQ